MTFKRMSRRWIAAGILSMSLVLSAAIGAAAWSTTHDGVYLEALSFVHMDGDFLDWDGNSHTLADQNLYYIAVHSTGEEQCNLIWSTDWSSGWTTGNTDDFVYAEGDGHYTYPPACIIGTQTLRSHGDHLFQDPGFEPEIDFSIDTYAREYP